MDVNPTVLISQFTDHTEIKQIRLFQLELLYKLRSYPLKVKA